MLITFLIVMIALVIDLFISNIADIVNSQIVTFWGISLFVALSVVYVVGQYLIIGMVKTKNKEDNVSSYNVKKFDVDISYISRENFSSIQNKADIAVVLRNESDSSVCSNQYGYSQPFREQIDPHYVIIYTSCGQSKFTNDQISTAVMHEFGHALGLGHAHNKDKDLMCSVEYGAKTCSVLLNSFTLPSDLDIKSMLYMAMTGLGL